LTCYPRRSPFFISGELVGLVGSVVVLITELEPKKEEADLPIAQAASALFPSTTFLEASVNGENLITGLDRVKHRRSHAPKTAVRLDWYAFPP
jgi:hypothetical protein